MSALTDEQVARARMRSLLLVESPASTCHDIASWFGAMQAQDAGSGAFSLGVRLPEPSQSHVESAFERADVIRTWPMRGTIHVIPAEDARWMLELTGSRSLAAYEGRRRQLGLDSASADRAVVVLSDALTASARLTRSACLQALRDEGIPTDGQRGYHLLWFAAVQGVICIGPQVGTQQTFTLLDRCAPDQVQLVGDDALTELAYRFFRSHGPAPVTDFAGWSGLTVTAARRGVALNEGRLVSRRHADRDTWLTPDLAERLDSADWRQWSVAVALPGFDEFVLGYKDRRIPVGDEGLERIVPGGNGMFRSTVCVDGRAVATWTRTVRRDRVDVAVEAFPGLSAAQQARIAGSYERYTRFVGLPVRLV